MHGVIAARHQPNGLQSPTTSSHSLRTRRDIGARKIRGKLRYCGRWGRIVDGKMQRVKDDG